MVWKPLMFIFAYYELLMPVTNMQLKSPASHTMALTNSIFFCLAPNIDDVTKFGFSF